MTPTCQSSSERSNGAGKPGQGLSRCQRLTDSADFRNVFDRGTSLPGRLMVVWQGVGKGVCPRLGVIASRRSFSRSVDRNRARRLLREAFRLNRHRLKPDRDVVLVARRKILGADVHGVQDELLVLCRKAGLLEGE